MATQCPKKTVQRPFKRETESRTVSAEHFMATIAANVNNRKLTDKQFRKFIRNTLSIVIY